MTPIQKLILAAAFATSMPLAFAFPSLRAETTPPINAGAISVDELGPVFSHPLPAEEPPPSTSAKTPEKPQKNDILSLFQEDKPPVEEKNPLEEQAKNELKTLNDSENKTVQVGENKQPGVTIRSENVSKEIDLDSANPDSKALPGLLR